MKRPHTSLIIASIVAAGLLQTCVYYNTFFSAKRYFNDGLESKEKSKDDKIPASAIKSFDNSIDKCLKVLRDYPQSKYVDDAILLMGRALYEKGSFQEAVQTLSSLVANYPESKLKPDALYYLGLSYQEMKNYDNAITHFQNIVAEYPGYSKKKGVLYRLAEVQVSLERYADAVESLQLFLEEVDERLLRDRAVFLLAKCQFYLEEYDEAMNNFNSLAEKTSSISLRTESYFWLASSLSKAGDHDLAIQTLENLLETNLAPEDLMDAQKSLAVEYSITGRLEDALEEYRKLAIGFPETDVAAEAWYKCGLIELEEMDDLSNAKKYFMSAYKEAQNSDYGMKARQMSVELTRYSRMEELIEDGDPQKEPVALFLKGEFLLLQMKEPETALEVFSELSEKYPDSKWAPKAAYAVALILGDELGDTLSSQAAYRQVISRYDGTRYADYARIMLGLEIEPKETSFYADELEDEEMIPEYYVREDDLFRYEDITEDTTSVAEADTTSQDESGGE
ncbi:MAG: tetratricopeptide repeat protein [Candidatus Glassbacteria bacterium]